MSRNLTRSIHPSRTGRDARGSSLPALIAVTLAVSVFCAAGLWQMQRARYKDEIKTLAEAALRDAAIELPATPLRASELEFRPVHVRGEWVTNKTIFLDNKVRDGVVGYQVVTPLRIQAGNMHVLVNRGWVAAPPLRSELPSVPTPSGVIDISGIARAPTDRFLELSNQIQEGSVWQNLTIGRFQEWSKISLQPTVIYQQNASDDKLVRVSVAPEASGLNADRHRGYALTWFGLAFVTFVLALAAKLQTKNTHEQKT